MESSSLHADPLRFPIESTVRSEIGRHLERGARIVVAVSGGADSTALLTCLSRLRNEFELNLTAAHLDHAWRLSSAEDADWVAALGERLHIPVVIRRATADELPPPTAKPAAEERARHWRREQLQQIATECRVGWIAMGHTADDQAETVLHRLLRGTGLTGLAGIAPVSPLSADLRIFRPLLSLSRLEIETWLASLAQDWRTDPTNQDPHHTRNRIRNELLPLLQRDYNPQVKAALCRLAAQCRERLSAEAQPARETLAEALLEVTPAHVRLFCEPLLALPMAIRCEVFRQLWRAQRWPEQSMSFRHWTQLAELCSRADAPTSLTLPGRIQVTGRQSLLLIQQQSAE